MFGFVYNRFSQFPEIQGLFVGVGLACQGKYFLWDKESSENDSTMKKVGQKVAGIALVIAGCGLFFSHLETAKDIAFMPSSLKNKFFSLGSASGIVTDDKYEYAFNLGRSVRESTLDALYLGAESTADHNGAVDPLSMDSLPRCLERISEMAYKTITHPFEICDQLNLGSKAGLISNLVLGAHGSYLGMNLGKSFFMTFDRLPQRCFNGLSTKATIYLSSCLTGEESYLRPNFAEWLSWISQRTVSASKIVVVSPTCERLRNGKISIDLDIRFSALNFEKFGPSKQIYVNTSEGPAKWAFLSKCGIAGALGLVTNWQAARVAATLMQTTGMALEWVTDKAEGVIGNSAKKLGVYHPLAGKVAYAIPKFTGQLLSGAGKGMHSTMDRVIAPIGSLGFSMLLKASTLTKKTVFLATRGVLAATWLGSKAIEKSGDGAQWAADVGAEPTKSAVEKLGAYRPCLGSALYHSAKGAGKALSLIGKAALFGVDLTYKAVDWAERDKQQETA